MAKFYSMDCLGRCFANRGWNFINDVDIETALSGLKNEEALMCINSAILNKLNLIGDQLGILIIINKKLHEKKDKCETIEDGILSVLNFNISNDKYIKDCNTENLKVRARKTIARLINDGLKKVSEITEDLCMSKVNCGVSTWKEIEEWKSEQTGIRSQSGEVT